MSYWLDRLQAELQQAQAMSQARLIEAKLRRVAGERALQITPTGRRALAALLA